MKRANGAETAVFEMTQKMELLVGLLAASVTDGKRQKDQIRILYKAGFTPSRIAGFLDTTPNTVNVALSTMRKEKVIK